MIRTVKLFFEQFIQRDPVGSSDSSHGVRLATAALLVEMVGADYQQRQEEEQAVRSILQRDLQLTSDEAQQLFDLAVKEADSAACLHEFTQLINRSYSMDEKIMVVEMLWRVALADMELDKYEEHLVRKVADLLYVSHKDFIKAKHRVSTVIVGT